MTPDGGAARGGGDDACLVPGEAGAALVAEAVGLLHRALEGAVAATADARLAHAVDWESSAAARFREALEGSLGRLRDDVAALAVATGTPW